MRVFLTILFTTISFNAFALFGLGDKPEVESVVEVHAKQPARLIPGSLIEPVWKEARSNKELSKYTVRVVLSGLSDKYGNEKLIDIGGIVFDKPIISEIKKYKRSSSFYGSKNEIHQWALSQFKALDK